MLGYAGYIHAVISVLKALVTGHWSSWKQPAGITRCRYNTILTRLAVDQTPPKSSMKLKAPESFLAAAWAVGHLSHRKKTSWFSGHLLKDQVEADTLTFWLVVSDVYCCSHLFLWADWQWSQLIPIDYLIFWGRRRTNQPYSSFHHWLRRDAGLRCLQTFSAGRCKMPSGEKSTTPSAPI